MEYYQKFGEKLFTTFVLETLMDGNFRSKQKRSLEGSINNNSSLTTAEYLEIESYGNDDLDERIIVG